MASLARVIAAGLVTRDPRIADATLVADSAVTVFGAAYAAWADSPDAEFAELMQSVLAQLRAAVGGEAAVAGRDAVGARGGD